jgi:hypothetical protein
MFSRFINKLLGNKWFPNSIRILGLLVFIGLVIIGFSSPTEDPFFNEQLSKTNLTSSFVWRLWWPLLIISAIFFGRVWCMVCPVEIITTFFAKIGLKLKRPRWLLSGWVITVFYILVLTLGITILHIDLNPAYTSYYLLFIMGLAIISGIFFEKNTFCRYICPIGFLLGIFSRLAAWGWRVKDESVCATCKDKSCISKQYSYQLNYKSCGVDLVPSQIMDNSYCILCGGCLKTCKSYNSDNYLSRPNPAFVKIGFANDLLQFQPLRWPEWFFLFFLTGSMFFELNHFQIISDISASLWLKEVSLSSGMNDGIAKEIIGLLYLYLLLPVGLWFIPYLLTRVSGCRITLSTYLKKVSLIFLPVIAATFVATVIMEIVTKFPYYKYILHDIKGVETIKGILFRQIEIPVMPAWTEYAFSIVLILALVLGMMISLRVTRKLITNMAIRKSPIILYTLPFFYVAFLVVGAILYSVF